jgi:hypothetical protein
MVSFSGDSRLVRANSVVDDSSRSRRTTAITLSNSAKASAGRVVVITTARMPARRAASTPIGASSNTMQLAGPRPALGRFQEHVRMRLAARDVGGADDGVEVAAQVQFVEREHDVQRRRGEVATASLPRRAPRRGTRSSKPSTAARCGAVHLAVQRILFAASAAILRRSRLAHVALAHDLAALAAGGLAEEGVRFDDRRGARRRSSHDLVWKAMLSTMVPSMSKMNARAALLIVSSSSFTRLASATRK